MPRITTGETCAVITAQNKDLALVDELIGGSVGNYTISSRDDNPQRTPRCSQSKPT